VAKRNVIAGNISGVSGEVNIAGGDIVKGFTADQVSILIKQFASKFQVKPFDGRCPYKGLDAFDEEDSALYFGREKLVEDLVSRMHVSRTVFITGPSGSGKSSLVRAGLIHALKQGAIAELHSDRWLYETMKPGLDPLGELARVTSSFAGTLNAGEDIRTKGLSNAMVLAQWCEIALKDGRDRRAVLFIDQFEEFFTQVGVKDAERVAFLNLLTNAATSENGRVIVLFSMRSDFVPNCAIYPQFNALLNSQFVQIGAMQPDELVSAIAQPALRVGLHIDPDLIAQIIYDMRGEPGSLPLMQFSLKDLFDVEKVKGGVIALTLTGYIQRGGIYKSLERHADGVLIKLNGSEQALARSVFARLIEIGRGTQDTRRTALFDELVPAGTKAKDVEKVITVLTDARLITTDQRAGKQTVTLSHEKLIEAWPWLKKLVDENRDGIVLQNKIAADTKEWDDHKEEPSYLYTGSRLINACEQLEARKIDLSERAWDFIDAGVRAYVDVLEEAQRRAAQLRQRALYLSIALAAALIAVGIAFFFGVQARQQTTIARAGELAVQSASIGDTDFQVSLLLGLEAYRTLINPQTRGTILDNADSHPEILQYLVGNASSVKSVAFSPDGKMLASGSCGKTDDNQKCTQGEIVLWDMVTGQPIGQPLTGHSDWVSSVIFSPDGKTLVSNSYDKTIILWDVKTHQPISQPVTGVYNVAFSPNGHSLAFGGCGKVANSKCIQGEILLWDMTTRQFIGQPLLGHTGRVESLVFRPDGKTLASGGVDGTIILWDVATGQPIGQPLSGQTYGISSMAFSPDGKTLASGSYDKTIILWDVATRQSIGQPIAEQRLEQVTSVAFSPDGKTLASSALNGNIILWDVATHQSIGERYTEPSPTVNSVAFSPDGKMLASGSDENTIILWAVGTGPSIGQPLTGHTNWLSSVAFSPDGKMLASGGCGKVVNYSCLQGEILLWDVATHQPIGQPLTGHKSSVSLVSFSPDSKTLASASDDGTIILWDVVSHQPIGQPLAEHTVDVSSIAFSPDGKILASGNCGKMDEFDTCLQGEIILWDVATHQPIGQPLTLSTSWVNSVAFSPDGKTLAFDGCVKTVDSVCTKNEITLWDVVTHRSIGQLLTGLSILVFSPDGKILASGGCGKVENDSRCSQGEILLWNVKSRQPIQQPLIGHTDLITSVSFSPDGKTIASSSEDGTIILWDVATRQTIGQPLKDPSHWVTSIAFNPLDNGKTLASGDDDGTITMWNVDSQIWARKTCLRVGRNLTRTEWARYFPNDAYRKTCPQWPLEPEATPPANPMP
jgi:WD40 repeat protein